jgi:hypothetical protein
MNYWHEITEGGIPRFADAVRRRPWIRRAKLKIIAGRTPVKLLAHKGSSEDEGRPTKKPFVAGRRYSCPIARN